MLLTRSPLAARLPRAAARLACVKHSASVQSEPGSNSSVQSVFLLLAQTNLGGQICIQPSSYYSCKRLLLFNSSASAAADPSRSTFALPSELRPSLPAQPSTRTFDLSTAAHHHLQHRKHLHLSVVRFLKNVAALLRSAAKRGALYGPIFFGQQFRRNFFDESHTSVTRANFLLPT